MWRVKTKGMTTVQRTLSIPEMDVKNIAFTLFLISFFLILSYDRLHHWDESFYLYKAAFVPVSEYGTFLTAKYGHLLLMKAIISLTGTGLSGLFCLDLIYALMMLFFVFVSFRLLNELLDRESDATYTTIILMFLPITLYLSFKTLSEVPALLLGTLSILSFYLGLKEGYGCRALFYISSSGILLFFATVCRSDASIMFFSFVLALTAIYGREFGLKKLFSSLAVVCIIFSILLFVLIVLLDIDIFSYYFSDVHRAVMCYQNIFGRLFGICLEGALFYPLMLWSFLSYGEKRFKFALIWFISASTPIWIVSNHIEARFLYHNLLPFAILIFIGSLKLFNVLGGAIADKNVIKIGSIAVFISILAGNIFFMGFMENELDESAYSRVFEKMDALYDNKTILTPYTFSDYSFLTFAFPDEQIFTVQKIESIKEEEKRIGDNYGIEPLRDLESLGQFNDTTILYISWRYQMDYLLFKNNEYSVYNYGWITEEPGIELEKIFEEGRVEKRLYEVYSVNIT
uniref:Glycosyltransferase RgtA/B/C/D-like domain-containing protein n=1 Tax=Candidatus Methanogaster sp. ANME-2c ERB4 TaxID=2759911 RepID=A0A7G9YRS5_9EURY|nr:hypothetical protein HLBKPKBF_00027 [Methanosarcinales archaeon ANME-2c ERB4]